MQIFGIDVHNEDFGVPVVDYEAPHTYDLVCFFDSLEHFPSFEPIFQLRSRNVIVSIPNPPEFLLTTPDRWRHYKPGEHLHYFNPSSLDHLMRRLGFGRKVVQAHPEDAIRGKIQYDTRQHDNIVTIIYSRS